MRMSSVVILQEITIQKHAYKLIFSVSYTILIDSPQIFFEENIWTNI